MLLTCDEDNIGSRKVIENNGGTLEKMLAEAPTTLQYFPMRRSRDFLALGTDSEVR